MIPDRRVHFVSLGCPKNRVDAEHMLAILGVKGWQVVDEPDRAEAIVVNTCAFIDESKEESVDAILEMARPKTRPLPSLGRERLPRAALRRPPAEEMPEVDYSGDRHAKISEVLERAGDMPGGSSPTPTSWRRPPSHVPTRCRGTRRTQDRRGLLEQMCVLHHPNAAGAKQPRD